MRGRAELLTTYIEQSASVFNKSFLYISMNVYAYYMVVVGKGYKRGQENQTLVNYYYALVRMNGTCVSVYILLMLFD